MGVNGLWRLLEPAGRTVSLESLEGHVLAIDASIWLTSFVKAMRDDEGKLVKNAHLIGTLRRCLKLMYMRIRPVFVFDGSAPVLKQKTMRKRRALHEQHEGNYKKAAEKILLHQLKQSILTAKNPSLDPQNILPTFHPLQSISNAELVKSRDRNMREEDDADVILSGVCQHWPLAGSRIRMTEIDGKMRFGHVIDDDQLVEEMRSYGSIPVVFKTDDEVRLEVPYPDKSIALIEPCSICHPTRPQDQLLLNPPIPTGSSSSNKKPLSTKQSRNEVYERRGRLYESDDESLGESGDDEGEWVIPQDANIDMETLANMPLQLRNDFIQSSRRQERARNRAVLIPTASNPELYSSSQVTNFLKSSRFNRNIEKIQRALETEQFPADITVADTRSTAPLVVGDDDADSTHVNKRKLVIRDDDDDSDGEKALCSLYQNDSLKIEEGLSKDPLSTSSQSESLVYLNTSSTPRLHESSTDPGLQGTMTSHQDKLEEVDEDDDYNIAWESGSDASDEALPPPLAPRDESRVRESAVMERAISTASSMAGWAADAVKKALHSHGMSLRPDPIPQSSVSEPLRSLTASSSIVQQIVDFPAISPVQESIAATSIMSSSSPSYNPIATTHAASSLIAPMGEPSRDMNHDKCLSLHVEVIPLPPQSITAIARIGPGFLEDALEEDVLAARIKASRDMETVTLSMKQDVMDLLTLLHLPYLVAPFEAEAQCAVLESLGLVDGVVTEDSDAFLFGAQAVYRNVFEDKKNVEVFKSSDIAADLGLSRNDLIGMAYFLGSDYCDGINGIGIVNALEIVQCFPMKNNPIEGLTMFSEWLNNFNVDEILGAAKEDIKPLDKQSAFKIKHKMEKKRWSAPITFPDPQIAKEYLSPAADRDTTPFEWLPPDTTKVKEFCIDTLGWTEYEVAKKLDPVMKRWRESPSTQMRMDSYLINYGDNRRFAKIKSVRLREAVEGMTGRDSDHLAIQAPEATSKSKRRKITSKNSIDE